MALNFKNRLKQLRLVFVFIRVILVLFLMIIAFLLGVNLIRYFFERPYSDFNASIKNAEQFIVRMNTEGCDEAIDSLDREHIRFFITSPLWENYSVLSKDKPISTTIILANGKMDMEGQPLDSDKIITSTRGITNHTNFQFMADEISVNFGSGADVRLDHDICTSQMTYYPDDGFFGFTRYSEKASGLTKQTFIRAGQVISVNLQNVEYQGQRFDRLSFNFVSNEKYLYSSADFLVYGQNIEISVPNGYPIDQEKPWLRIPFYTQLAEIRARIVEVYNPIGTIDFEYDGVTDLSASPSGRNRTLFFGYAEDVIYERESIVYVHPASLFEQNAQGYIMGGATANAQLDEIQLVKNRWEKSSPELQAVLVTAILALLGWIAQKLLSKTNDFIAKLEIEEPINGKDDKEAILNKQNAQLIEIPAGYNVFILSSGYAVAGVVSKEPNLWSKKYVLKHAFIRNSEDQWQPSLLSEIIIVANKVIYTYAITAKK